MSKLDLDKLREKLKGYILSSRYYGKPYKNTHISGFWRRFGDYIIENEFKMYDWFGSKLDEYWVTGVVNETCKYTGGFEFYKFIETNQHSINSFNDFDSLIINFKYEPLLPIEKEKQLKILKDERAFYFDNTKVYVNNAMNEILIFNKDCRYMINTDGKIIEVKEDIAKEILKLSYDKDYLGVILNQFCLVPTMESRDKLLDILLKAGLIEAKVPKVKESEHSDISDTAKESEHSEKSDNATRSDESLVSEESKIAEESLISEESKTSEESDHAKIADELSEEGFNKVLDGLMEVFSDKNSKQSNILAALVAELNSKKKHEELHTYKYQDRFNGEFTTGDIYTDELINNAIDKLKTVGRLLITGDTGSGKSELAYLLTNKLTGESMGKTAGELGFQFRRICMASGRTGESFWYEDDNHATIGALRLFVEHIKKNEITEPCVFIGNEIQTSDFGFLVGQLLFELFNTFERPDILPENLYLIFVGCDKQDFGLDNQIFERLPSVKLTYYTDNEGCTLDKNKIISLFGFEDIIDTIGKLNKIEEDETGYSVISVRQMIAKIGKHGEISLSDEIKKDMSEESLKLVKKLEDK